jgi:hypothetical protein
MGTEKIVTHGDSRELTLGKKNNVFEEYPLVNI